MKHCLTYLADKSWACVALLAAICAALLGYWTGQTQRDNEDI
jgi:hypothetical protein